ncbi:JAB domain-containing protein [Yanghanlia caeni]|uniref:JAB domain-containing protein n=1 Tax=Yanghanlia caeni TaxID=3064283 RepID=A0ABU1D9M8_9BURK|nr:JAB domain-containing protein [Alcaligenaceae bacterium LG-2]
MNNSTAALSYDNMNNEHALYVRSPAGRYKLASDEQILAAGRMAAESLVSHSSPVDQPTKVRKFFQAKLAGLGHECAAFLYLDSRLKPIRYIEQGPGTLSQASVYPREIVKTALRLNAAALIMAHYVSRHIMRLMCPIFLCARHRKYGVLPRSSNAGWAHNGSLTGQAYLCRYDRRMVVFRD